MKDVSAFEAKNTLGTLLDRVERGEEITITRRGKPIAKLVRRNAGIGRDRARAAAERIRTRSKGVTLGGIPLKELIDDGRR